MTSATSQSEVSTGAVLLPCKFIVMFAGNGEVIFETVVRTTPFDLNPLELPPVWHITRQLVSFTPEVLVIHASG